MKRGGIITWAKLILIAFVLGYTGICFAEDFTFNVPVQLYNVQSTTGSGYVYCETTNRFASLRKDSYIGNGVSPYFNITGASYVGTVTVKFNAGSGTTTGNTPASGAKAVDATDWSCILHILVPQRQGVATTPDCQPPGDCVQQNQLPGSVDTFKTVTTKVSGTLK